MPRRFTITEKWDDNWFRRLSPLAKNLWEYIRDKCDCAGFWEIDLEWAAKSIRTTEARTAHALTELPPKIIQHNGWLWIRKFIPHQGNWPLNPENNAHKGILRRLAEHSDFGIDFQEEMLKQVRLEAPHKGLISPIGKGKGKYKGKGKEYSPPFEQFWKDFKGRWNAKMQRYDKVGKREAFEAFEELTQSEQRHAVAVANRAGGEFLPDACRWLARKRFEDYPIPKALAGKEQADEQA
jgi:hypothetical protein